MGKIQELYETRVRPMEPAERLQLAKLILDDLARSENPVDTSDEWSDDDVADLSAFSAQHADTPHDSESKPRILAMSCGSNFPASCKPSVDPL